MIIPFVLAIGKEFVKVILVVLWLVLVHLPPMMFKWVSLPLVLVKDAESKAGQTGSQEFRTTYLGLNQLCAPTARQHEPTCMVSGNDGSYQEAHQETHPQAYKEAHREAYQDTHQDAHQETYNETNEEANLIAYLDKPLNC